MPEILIAALSPVGHFGPLLNVARGLVDRGERVTVLSGAAHEREIRSVGATPATLPPQGDLDLDLLEPDSGREEISGIKRLNFDIVRLFVAPMPHQAKALAELLTQKRFDAILADYGFFGVLPFVLGERSARPPVLLFSTTPLMISSRDTAPAGLGLPPSTSTFGRLRNRALTLLSQKVLLRPAHKAANCQLHRFNSPELPTFLLDVGVLADRLIVPTVPEFDYPRSDLPANTRYVGMVHPSPTMRFRPPVWWQKLDGDRPVVHVTQGTVDNSDPRRLLQPTIEALADENVMVVATTGGPHVSELGFPIPHNAYVADYLPHDLLLPKVDVMVTNGGYGGVQRALSTGVPLVVAGNTEDKPEVAARVAWSGAGIDLRTGDPTAKAIRAAVREVLGDGRYLRRARELEAAYAQRDGVAEIAALIDEVIGERAVAP
ncbi:nucleotide disphospho-sugar-binding domain-containing protein [Mycolicibacterium sp. 120270]|uniref:nucleotide disphospho-sugar-binding domain-containing protein n=1 Tax=Mycolicibacterium sp. 120270 TaxID=3090600 RepID=UPI00299F13E2|nr:nucleotide disphospho-sugar-binding domain-containing protein [Mycolicibacterium sp. 120270]MDX1882085.1 glycosyltransferase [Mycolicibacterium sp. 120270]